MLAVQATLVPILLKVDRRCRRDILLQSVEITFKISPHSSIADVYLPTDIPIAPEKSVSKAALSRGSADFESAGVRNADEKKRDLRS